MQVYFKNGDTFTSLLDLVYPVGSYYISNKKTSPAKLFGGSWSKETQGHFLMSDTQDATDKKYLAGYVGGSETHTHYLRLSWFGSGRHLLAPWAENATPNSFDDAFFSLISDSENSTVKDNTKDIPWTDDSLGVSGYMGYNRRYVDSTSGNAAEGIYGGNITRGDAWKYHITTTMTGSNLPPYVVVYIWFRVD